MLFYLSKIISLCDFWSLPHSNSFSSLMEASLDHLSRTFKFCYSFVPFQSLLPALSLFLQLIALPPIFILLFLLALHISSYFQPYKGLTHSTGNDSPPFISETFATLWLQVSLEADHLTVILFPFTSLLHHLQSIPGPLYFANPCFVQHQ